MVKMTKNSAMGGLLEPIKNSAIWKSVLREAVLREAQVYLKLKTILDLNTQNCYQGYKNRCGGRDSKSWTP